MRRGIGVIYLYWYLGVGVTFIAIAWVVARLKKKASESIYDSPFSILDALMFVPCFILIVAIWPVLFYMTVEDMFKKKESAEAEEERKFAVEREHLIERLSVQEIEMREIVIDPLKAVPELPFGYLNAVWKEFLNDNTGSDELWSFSAHWQTTYGRKEQRSGYVIVQEGEPGDYFLTVWKIIPDEAEAEAHDSGKQECAYEIPEWLRRPVD
jgi:hypothetical protein